MTSNPLLDAALAYAAQGWPVFPCWPGHKNPVTEHGFKDATTDAAQIRAWWARHPNANVAIATGEASVDVLDIDIESGANGYGALAELQHAGLLDGYGAMVSTRSGGLHVYFKGTSQRSSDARDNSPVDFKASGGYVLAPPSYVEADDMPAGHYHWISKGEATAALDWRMTRDLLVPPPAFQQPAAEHAARNGDRNWPGDDYAARTDWADVLGPDWRPMRQIGGVRYWQRPGKTGRGISASTRDDGGLWVFSTNAPPFEPETLYSKFGAYAALHGYGKDYKAAAAALRLAGHGDQVTTLATIQTPSSDAQDAVGPEHTTWHPRDLQPILDGDTSGDPKPQMLARADKEFLIYRGKVNALIGESESGKTWIALLAVVQAVTAGCQVLYLDFEDAPAGIIGRLRSLGLDPGQLADYFRYIAPDEPLTPAASIDLGNALAAPAPDLIILDGVNAAMTLLGFNLKDNMDVTTFSQRVLRPLKHTGAAVLTVDHVTKDRESRGAYAIGAQAKRADIDGAAFIVEAVKKFGRGQQGKLKLTVSKDRPGHVRAISAGATYAGTVNLTSHEDGTVAIEIIEPDMRPAEDKPKFRPTDYMEKVSTYLEGSDGDSKRGIRAAVTGRSEYIDIALDRLVEDGYLSHEPGQPYRSVKPYRRDDGLRFTDRDHRDPTVPNRDPGHGLGE